jgi:hypothetical protein
MAQTRGKNFQREADKTRDHDTVFHVRSRFTIAQVEVGATVVFADRNYKIRVIDISLISIGGAVGGATDVRILATQSGASAALLIAAAAALTQNTLARAGAANMTILAAGAAFLANDLNTPITIGKTGAALTTATHIDVILTYALDPR